LTLYREAIPEGFETPNLFVAQGKFVGCGQKGWILSPESEG
jgi:hypothetical protein